MLKPETVRHLVANNLVHRAEVIMNQAGQIQIRLVFENGEGDTVCHAAGTPMVFSATDTALLRLAEFGIMEASVVLSEAYTVRLQARKAHNNRRQAAVRAAKKEAAPTARPSSAKKS